MPELRLEVKNVIIIIGIRMIVPLEIYLTIKFN